MAEVATVADYSIFVPGLTYASSPNLSLKGKGKQTAFEEMGTKTLDPG